MIVTTFLHTSISKSLMAVVLRGIKSKSDVDFTKDLLKYKTILPLYLQICNLSVIEVRNNFRTVRE